MSRTKKKTLRRRLLQTEEFLRDRDCQSAVPDDAAAAGSEVASGEGELGQLGDDFLGFSEDLGGL